MATENMDMDYSKYDFKDSTELYVHLSKKGLSKDVVRSISKLKDEPQWMLDFRLRAYDIFMKKPMPTWGADLSTIDFQNIFYYAKATEKTEKSWDDVPEDVKNTFDKLGIPEAEKKFLAGVGAQYESEVVYHSLREDLQKQGVLFTDTDTALKEHPELMKKYFGKIIPPEDNKFAALNNTKLYEKILWQDHTTPTPARNFFSASGMPSLSKVFLTSSGTSSQLFSVFSVAFA